MLFSLKNVNLEKEMDMTLHFVSRSLDESGHNSKPVLFHSFKVGTILYELGYSKDIIISGTLHDLLEDTDISYEDICDSFGEKIAGCVLAATFDSKISDKLEQDRNMFLNCIKFGNEALIVKCADLLDNIKYVNLVADVDVKNDLLKKYDMFLEMSKQYIGNEKIYSILENEVQKQKEV
jgi:guanosine-3',5'-bis(diphosphate) 3'-pyrophosphohydrolase